MTADNLGDRMKDYEARETERRFLPMLPVYARIDGRRFTSLTRNMARPFDFRMMAAMVQTTAALVERTHARIGYTQSDEINLVWLQEEYGSEIFFSGKVHKMTSILAGLATAAFNAAIVGQGPAFLDYALYLPHFDARVFQLPSKEEAANAFLWRELDATKNAIQSAARTVYAHFDLQDRNSREMQEMMFAKGINFDRYPAAFKRGTFVRKRLVQRTMTEAEREKIPLKHRPPPSELFTRSEVVAIPMPKFKTVQNRVGVIFDGEDPIVGAKS